MQPPFNNLVLSCSGSLAEIALNRPDVHNALDEHLIAELTAAYDQLNGDPEIRTIAIFGNGKSFCAGAGPRLATNPAQNNSNSNGSRPVMSLRKSKLVCLALPAVAFWLPLALAFAVGERRLINAQ